MLRATLERRMETMVSPSSPGVSPVSLSDCIEELLKFLLSASSNETLGIDLGLSKTYCSSILSPEPGDGGKPDATDAAAVSGGFPVYPLYKRLASALCSCITSGNFVKTCNPNMPIQENESIKNKEIEWRKLIASEGAELVKMLEVANFELHVQEPFFSQLRAAGQKTIEGRCATGDYNRISPGSVLLINKCLLLEVQNVGCYASFSKMLEAEGLCRVLPGIETTEKGVQIYRQFYTEEKEKSNGVLAIHISRAAIQPYISMANIVHGLSYNGIGSLLGLMHTEGTIPDALPPSRLALMSSFMLPHHSNVKGNTLTGGARALAKHVHRSSNGWWGNFTGSDSDKNGFALSVINHLIMHCCWMNIYHIQPHECVFEIRIDEGYGARWSRDGSKFIGFLEPYMEDGHLKGWRH